MNAMIIVPIWTTDIRRWFLTSLSRNASSKARNDCSLEWEKSGLR
jgi:hypothetical protein